MKTPLVISSLLLTAAPGFALVSLGWLDPGWDYEYTGNAAAYGSSVASNNNNNPPFDALDGRWSHQNGSDEWGNAGVFTADAPGAGNGDLGGAGIVTDGSVSALRIVDAKNAGATADNRKIAFTKDLTTVPNHANPHLGVTLTFRARLLPTAALEGSVLNATNRGGLIGSGGKGMFGIRLETGTAAGMISFSLHDAVEDINASGGTLGFAGPGLVLNKNNGDTVSANSDTTVAGGTLNDISLASVDVWHEFWVNIVENDATAGNGTHTVTVWVDGAAAPVGTYNVTAGNGSENGNVPAGYLFMGHNQTTMVSGFDVDFFAVKNGLVLPTVVPEPASLTLAALAGAGMLRRRRRA